MVNRDIYYLKLIIIMEKSQHDDLLHAMLLYSRKKKILSLWSEYLEKKISSEELLNCLEDISDKCSKLVGIFDSKYPADQLESIKIKKELGLCNPDQIKLYSTFSIICMSMIDILIEGFEEEEISESYFTTNLKNALEDFQQFDDIDLDDFELYFNN